MSRSGPARGAGRALEVWQGREEALPDRQLGRARTEGAGVVVGHRSSLKVHSRLSKVTAWAASPGRVRTCSRLGVGSVAQQDEPGAEVVGRLDDLRRALGRVGVPGELGQSPAGDASSGPWPGRANTRWCRRPVRAPSHRTSGVSWRVSPASPEPGATRRSARGPGHRSSIVLPRLVRCHPSPGALSAQQALEQGQAGVEILDGVGDP